jgi:hypothetical protein
MKARQRSIARRKPSIAQGVDRRPSNEARAALERRLARADPREAPAFRHVSSSQRGGWLLFGRLLTWATRNNGDGEGQA